MRILFDQGTPAPLRSSLPGHEIATTHERGWGTLQNGDLLRMAEVSGFDAIITTDQNLRYQQNLTERHLAVIVLLTTNWPQIRPHVSLIASAVDQLAPNAYVELAFPQQSDAKQF